MEHPIYDRSPIIKKIVGVFDRLEDRVRGHLSHYPVLYTFIGGIAIVLFWRGVWHTADILQAKGGFLGWLFYEPTSLIIVVGILLLTGLFVSYFIGDTILISGLKREKKSTEKTEREIKEEEHEIGQMRDTIKEMKKEVDEIKDFVEHVATEHEAAHHGAGKGEEKK
ncbi:MAG: hypothetical protein WCV82_01890 [Candidatus Paceibacterota bacterium]